MAQTTGRDAAQREGLRLLVTRLELCSSVVGKMPNVAAFDRVQTNERDA